MTGADNAVAGLINGNLTLALGTNLFLGPMRAVSTTIPVISVFVLETGGLQPDNFCDGSVYSPQIYHPSVQVMIRGAIDNYASGKTLADGVYGLVHDILPSGYSYCRATSSTPLYLGTDDAGSHIFSINFDMWTAITGD